MKRRLLAIMAFLCMIVGLLPTTALATDGIAWTDAVLQQPSGYAVDDAGNVNISSPEGLAWLAKLVNKEAQSFSGKRIVLKTPIDLSEHDWVPIGTQSCPFDGTFDGGDNEISGMSITVSENNTLAGLFGRVSNAVLENVVLQDARVSGYVNGEPNPNTNDERYTGLYIGGMAAALKEMSKTESNTVTISHCQVDLTVSISTNNGVVASIGGILGWTDGNWTGAQAKIDSTAVNLAVTHVADTGFYRSLIGGTIGELNTKAKSEISNGSIKLNVTLCGNGLMSGGDANKAIRVGGVVGGMPGVSNRSEPMVEISKVSSCASTDLSETTNVTNQAETDIGGVFGRGTYYKVGDCFAQIELTGNDGETPYHFGNLAGYTYNDEISCERVYTYAARYEGNAHFENEQLSKDNSNMSNYPLEDVYYIEPQELTEGVEGAPFLYKTFHDSHRVTDGINDGFVYRDGDSNDGITVTPSTDGKTVAITPADERCAVGGYLDLSSGFEVDFVLPVPVYPEGGGTYSITTKVKDLANPGGWTNCNVTTGPVRKAKAGNQVTITAKPSPPDTKLVDSVTVTTENGTPVDVTKTAGYVTGNQTYIFTMPASNVTVTGVFRAISTEFTLSPSTVTFDVYEGYTAEDVESKTVTIANTGDTDVTLKGSCALPTSTSYDIRPGEEGNWGGATGREITIAPGETATFTVTPKPGLTGAMNPNTNRLRFYSTEKELVYLTLQCNVTQVPVYTLTATPTTLTFEQLKEGYPSTSGQTVMLTNTGTGTLNVTLPTSEHFTITPDASWNNGAVSLAPHNSAAVTVTPRQGLTAGTYQDTICFATDQAGIEADVTASFSVSPGGSVTPPATTHTITASAGTGGSISPSGEVSVRDGADQTFTITPDEGNKVRDVVVDGASVGALGSYSFEDVRGDHAISVTFTRGNAPADPDDTGVSGWFETGDHDAFLHGYDDGTGRFGPEDNMTRGEAAQMFYNMLKDKSRGSVAFDFEDLPEGAWYHEAVATLASHGILLGTSPTTVEPERPITRAEFTAMAMRFSKGDLSGENIFTDVSEGDWYYGVIVGSIKYGWISGYDDGTGRFGPNDNITRAQATIIANRMLGRVPDGVYINAHLGELTRFPDVSEGFYAFRDIVEATNSHDYSKDGGFEHWSRLR